MRKEAWLLTGDYITKNNSPVIRLWVKDKKGHIGLIHDPNFEPYFYAVLGDETNIEDLKEIISQVETTRYKEKITPKKIRVIEKKDFGDPIKVLKITANHPQHVPSLRKSISEIKGVREVREADIPFINRYIIDKGLTPSNKIDVQGKKFETEKADFGIKKQEIRSVDSEEKIPLKTLAFDCEMYNEGGTPNSDRDPIVIISTQVDDNQPKLFIADDMDDSKIINQFIECIEENDPDLIVTFNGDDFDWPYLRDRAEEHGISLRVGRDNTTPNWHGGSRQKVSVRGRLNVDLYRVAERDIGDVQMMSLEQVADYLGVMSENQRCNIEGSRIGEYWENEEKRDELLEYSKDDVKSTLGIAKELVPNQLEISRMNKQFLDKVSKMGRGSQVEWYLMSKAYSENELIPNKGNYAKRAQESYLGGFVLEPKRGLHENVVSLDFSSMYPSLMVSYNISPDTLVSKDELSELSKDQYYEAPEVGHKFKKEPEGFFKSILSNLIDRRNDIKEKIKNSELNQDKRLLNIRQKALKTLTNSFYGYTGWNAARWYKKECAEATTAWGREMIKKSIEAAKDKNFEVLYSDTDSIFVKYMGEGDTEKKSKQLAKELTQNLPLLLELEDFFETIFFTEKKKRYAGLKANGDIYIRGLEVRRGDWCQLAKEIQKEVIGEILRNKDPESAVEIVQKTINEIKKGKIPYENLIIRKTLKKKIENYKSKQAHVKAAQKAKKSGYEITPGGKVGFLVIERRGETVGEKAYPTEMINSYKNGKVEIEELGGRHSIDKNYYIDNQVLPAVLRILSYFGYSRNELKGEPHQKTFGDFGE
ncbi:DNA polymerase [archaeon SCG-AAA382B04]|nr:DNA polymerase [archaeon SCG-AAA382B04]